MAFWIRFGRKTRPGRKTCRVEAFSHCTHLSLCVGSQPTTGLTSEVEESGSSREGGPSRYAALCGTKANHYFSNALGTMTVEEFASAWLSDDRLCWGLGECSKRLRPVSTILSRIHPAVFQGPLLALNVGFWSTAALFEIANCFSWCTLTEYSTERPRRECLKDEPSTKHHLKDAMLTLVGPAAVANVFLLSKIGPILMPGPYHWEDSLVEAGSKFLAMMVIHDFLLYCTHRLQHESEFLFHRVHAYHHGIHTPRSLSSGVISYVDGALQEGLPCIVSCILVRPHPFLFYAFVIFRISESVANHSGVSASSWLSFIFAKSPLFYYLGRASFEHHDQHHRMGNRSKHAKNFAESFWIFDYLFGTLSRVKTVRIPQCKSS